MNTERNIVPTCSKCGSTERVIPDGYCVVTGQSHIAVDSQPEGFWTKGTVHVRTRVQVCCDCGYIEFYVRDYSKSNSTGIEELWTAYVKSQEER
jgi:predicted nucleic-acid-binding Zn-ribbon protein